MEQSILKSTKKVLGLDAAYTPFDHDIIIHINSVFMTLADLGIGPSETFMIEDDTKTWDDFLSGDNRVNAARQYMYMKTRMAFDPPQNQFGVTALENLIKELEWRINVRQEATNWVNPLPPLDELEGDDFVVDGGEV